MKDKCKYVLSSLCMNVDAIEVSKGLSTKRPVVGGLNPLMTFNLQVYVIYFKFGVYDMCLGVGVWHENKYYKTMYIS